MTNLELQAYRRFLMLKVSEASEYIGKTDVETWREWENGSLPIPENVAIKIFSQRENKTDYKQH